MINRGVNMQLQNKKINFLGDSITEGSGASEHPKCYVSQVADLSGAVCRNYGIGGTRIAKQTAASENPRYDLYFASRVDSMDSDADIIVVFGGTNDYGHGDAPIGTMQDRTPDTFYGGLHSLYLSLLEKYPESVIVVITPTHRCDEDNPCGSNKTEPVAPLKTYVNIIREVAEYYSFPVLDLFATSGIQPEVKLMKLKYMPDGLHPNDAGHRIIAKKVVAFLKNM